MDLVARRRCVSRAAARNSPSHARHLATLALRTPGAQQAHDQARWQLKSLQGDKPLKRVHICAAECEATAEVQDLILNSRSLWRSVSTGRSWKGLEGNRGRRSAYPSGRPDQSSSGRGVLPGEAERGFLSRTLLDTHLLCTYLKHYELQLYVQPKLNNRFVQPKC